MKPWWAVTGIPAATGLAAFLIVILAGISNPIVYLRADMAVLSLMAGTALSLLVSLILGGMWWRDRGWKKRIRAAQDRTVEEHIRFVRRLDHEIKNPLTAIRAGLANLSLLPEMADHQADVVSIDQQVIRLGQLLRDLRKLTEFEAYPIERVPINMADLLTEAVSVIQERPEAAERTINLTLLHAPWPLPKVIGDWDLLFLAIHNLLDNSLKYTLPGSTIEVRAFEDGISIHIEVADTGPGIPDDELPYIWEELARGYAARGISGSGLGLSLVRAITERHGGGVSLRSRVGHGSIFALHLPIS